MSKLRWQRLLILTACFLASPAWSTTVSDVDAAEINAKDGEVVYSKILAQSDTGLVDIRTVAPRIRHNMRYANNDNFTGHRITGYIAAKCLLHKPVAEALMRVEQGLQKNGYGLIIYDCYRPTIAVDDFMRWSKDLNDTSTKARYYPDLDKSKLVPDYIAEKSGHSKGATVDLGLLDCRTKPCVVLDMGTEFDFFGAQANTDFPHLTEIQRQNRKQLLTAMNEQGFENYPMEWWHFTWKAGVLPDLAYSFPIQ